MSQAEPGEVAEPAQAAGPAGVRDEAAEHEPEHRRWLGAVLAAGMTAALGAAVIGIPREHAALPAVARYALDVSLPRWGLTEPVNEVVYGTRGFDTFGETFLLLAAVRRIIELRRGPGIDPRSGHIHIGDARDHRHGLMQQRGAEPGRIINVVPKARHHERPETFHRG